MRFGLKLVYQCTLFLFCSTTVVSAARGVESVIIFGGVPEYLPHHYIDESGRPAGFDVALFEAIAAEAGWRTDYRFDNWSVIQRELEEGHIHVVPMFISEERRDRYLFTSPILSTAHRLFGRKGQVSQGSLNDLDGKKVAAEEGGYGWRELQRLNRNVRIASVQSEAEAIRLVAEGEVDYGLVADRIGYYVVEQQGFDNVVALSPSLLPVDYAFAVNPEWPDLVSEINRHLQMLRQRGVIDQLQEEWLNPPDEMDWREAVISSLWLVIPFLLVLTFAGYMLWRRRYQLFEATQLINSETSRRREAESRAEKLAVYDDLTGLPKTSFFKEYLDNSVAYAREERKPLVAAVLTLLDLEIIQQLAGYRVFDALIKLEAEALTREHRGFIAHLGEGRFGFVFENIEGPHEALKQLQQLIEVAGETYDVEDTPIEPHVACGVAVFPDHGYDGQQVFRAAELAMTVARRKRKPLLSYESSMEPDPRNLTLMRDLNKALTSNALSWAYQAKYSLGESRVIGAEMLIRWRHPRYGWLSPALFIPLAEKTGLIKSVTRSVLQEAMRTVQQWGKDGVDWNLSVNVSGNDLADPEIVEEIIGGFGDHASLLTLEVTETAIMQDIELITRHVEQLQEAGFTISLDDYGTGYSTLTYLKQLHFDELKIDMSFIKNMRNSTRDRKITSGSIRMGHELGASAVAEGVEDYSTAVLLREMKCDILQGYGIAKPMSLDEFVTFAADYILD